MKEPDGKKVDDIVSMLDAFMSGGGGRMNIRYDLDKDMSVNVANSTDCSGGNKTACSVPTLFEGMDHEEDNL